MRTGLIIYIIGLNLVLFFEMGRDKLAAKLGRRRTPEATLLSLAILGGSIGGILGMLVFRHKTRKLAFYLGLPLILLSQIAIAYLFVSA